MLEAIAAKAAETKKFVLIEKKNGIRNLLNYNPLLKLAPSSEFLHLKRGISLEQKIFTKNCIATTIFIIFQQDS